jgi:RNA polymerase sigma-70 factor (ECF subfamily)
MITNHSQTTHAPIHRYPEPPRSADEDFELLQRAIEGDRHAWSCFHQHFHRPVTYAVARVLRRYLGSYTDADLADYTAEIWVALLVDDRRRLRLYEPSRCRLSTWLKLLATNCTIDQLRTSGAYHSTRCTDDEVLACLADEQQLSAEVLVDQQQRAAMVTAALAQLKDKDRNFVISCLQEKQPTKEMARELGLSIHTIHSRKFKLRQKLARIVRRIERDQRFAA